METKFTWSPIHPNGTIIESTESTNNYSAEVAEVDYEIGLGVTNLRDDPDYIRYYINWTRLITTGIIPVTLLIYFNYGIFRGIQVRDFSASFRSIFFSDQTFCSIFTITHLSV